MLNKFVAYPLKRHRLFASYDIHVENVSEHIIFTLLSQIRLSFF